MEDSANRDLYWFQLDNAAKIYPAIRSKKDSCVFRMAVNLKQDVNPEILQQAVIDCRSRFPSMYVHLRRGLFWFYFENNRRTPKIKPEDSYINQRLNLAYNDFFLFTVFYYKKRISLECFHSLCDGTGAVEFLKAITFHYLELMGYGVESEGLVYTSSQSSRESEVEDSFLKNVSKEKKDRGSVKAAYHVKGKRFPRGMTRGVINGKLSASKLHDLAKSEGATITQYLVALLTFCILKAHKDDIPANRPVQVSVPVNMRKFFPSVSLRNFSLYFHTSVYVKPELSFDDVLSNVKMDFDSELNQAKLQRIINANVMAEKNMALRLTPLVIKQIALLISGTYLGSRLDTATMSNFGVVKLPSSMEDLVEDFDFNLATDADTVYGLGIITYKDTLTISFLRSIYSTETERLFFSFLAEKGISVEIQSNMWELHA